MRLSCAETSFAMRETGFVMRRRAFLLRKMASKNAPQFSHNVWVISDWRGGVSDVDVTDARNRRQRNR